MNSILLDPWDTSQIFSLNIGQNSILGPVLDKKSRIRHEIVCMYEYNDDGKYYLYTIHNNSEFKNLYLKMSQTESIIENISKSKIYSGSEYVILGLQIIYRLFGHIEKYNCKLIDSSFFICDFKKNLFKPFTNNIINKKEEVQHKMIILLRFGSTFYMYFGFIPYNKINMKNINDDILKLVSQLWDIKWSDIDSYMKKMIEIVLSNKYKTNIMIRNYNKWYNYWINISKSWILFKEKFSSISPTPFRSFSFFNYEECGEFINWLELYSFRYMNYNKFVFNNINNSSREMSGIVLFKKLYNTINNVVWINNKIISQPIISNLKK
jgi:hypothetical protein